VSPLRLSSTSLSWAALVGLGILSWVVYQFVWAGAYYRIALYSLAIASLVLAAVIVLTRSSHRLWSLLVAVVVLIAGQWWWVQSMAARLIWSTRGFAP
jgi:hypothetical protein